MNRRQILIGTGAATLALAGASYAEWRQMGSLEAYEKSVAAMRSPFAARPETRELIRAATLAPSGHNTQPWVFSAEADAIRIHPDLSRRTPIVDPDDHHLFVSLGCAAENLAITGNAMGRSGALSFDATERTVSYAFGDAPPGDPALFDAIAKRQSTRADYDGRRVSAADLKRLETAAAVPGITLVVLTEPSVVAPVRDMVIAGNDLQMGDPAFIRELKAWLRFSPRQALRLGDGLFSAASGSPSLPDWLGPKLFDLSFNAAAENEKYARHLNSSAGVAVFVSDKDDSDHWFRAGRACQRFSLQATALGLKTAFVNQPVEVASLRPELASLVGLAGRRPDLVMRFGYGSELPYSARRPVQAVLRH
ncbi:Acg family FMN-binding oxidoreductase [Rhizobium sp. 22-785-1]